MKSKETKKYLMCGIVVIAALLLVIFTGLNLNVLSPATVTDENTFWTIDNVRYEDGNNDDYKAYIAVTYNNDHPIYDEDRGFGICETFLFRFYTEGYYGMQAIEDVYIPYGSSYQMNFLESSLPGELTTGRLTVNGFDKNGYRFVESNELLIPIEPNPTPEPSESTPGFTIFITLMAILSVLYYQRK